MGRIHEIQGLRAVAALLVAVYHIWFNRVSGGVDAFFVIAAFFLMSSFARIGRPAKDDVLRYYASTVRRVVPLAAVVILATIVGTLLLFPRIIWSEFAYHALASAVFAENWWLAWSGTDYLRLGLAISPFQQMWALSLQMQYYLVLPLLLWGVSAFAARRGLPVRAAWTAALAALLVLSFAYNLWITATNQPWAYFDSVARCWEYMMGALLALQFDRLPALPRWAARVLGYACFLVLISFAAVIPIANSFPGTAALIPVLSTMGLIVAARAGAGIVPLTSRPVAALGEISFSFYLWHWPLLIFWRQWTGHVAVGLLPGLAIIGLAGLLAFSTLRLIEAPFRNSPRLVARPALSLVAGLLVMLMPLGATYAWTAVNRAAVRDAQAILSAFAANPRGWSDNGTIVPDPLLARTDNPRAYADGCQQTISNPKPIECIYGVENGSRTVVLVGGSHSLQWLPALEDLAPELDLRIVSMTKSSCAFLDSRNRKAFMAAAKFFGLNNPGSCLKWNAAVEARIIALAPDLVLTIGTRGQGAKETVPKVYRSLWANIEAAGIPILALRDNPWFPSDVVECVARAADDPARCDAPRAALLGPVDPGAGLDSKLLTFADFTDLYCDEARCWAVHDGLLLYRDKHHLTASFVRAKADRLGQKIEAIIGKS